MLQGLGANFLGGALNLATGTPQIITPPAEAPKSDNTALYIALAVLAFLLILVLVVILIRKGAGK